MQRLDDGLIVSPSDLNNFLDCEYLTRLDLEVAGGRVVEKHRSDEADLLAAKGEAHERRYLEQFEQQGRTVVRIGGDSSSAAWSDAAGRTRRAAAGGADVIYQAALVADGWRGRADFLVRVETPSALGGWSYEAWDTKLARHARPSHLLQLAYYTERVGEIQGLPPESMHLVLGTGEHARFRFRDVSSYFRVLCDRFLRATGQANGELSPYPVSHCELCGYRDHCADHWVRVDHLSLIAAIRRSQVARFNEAGILTTAALAAHDGHVAGIGPVALDRLRHQAKLQLHFRTTRQHRYDLLPDGDENGFRLLPPPSPGDVYFDMEGFPFFDTEGGLEYLFGSVTTDDGTRFHPFRATDRAGEQRAFEQFIDFVWERLKRWPGLHVYHYAHYEPTALKRLMTVHATREDELDELLRREVFVDLFQVVRRSMRISHDSYSIKAVRQFFMPEAGKGAVTGGGQSILEFQRWLDTGDRTILDAIERYNEEDCVSTQQLHRWLLERRLEAERSFGVEIPFRALPKDREDPVETEPDGHEERRRVLGELSQPWAALLGHLLSYHRREAKPEWWAYFERTKKSLDELIDDTEAIAYVKATNDPPVPDARSLVHTLEFPPQEFKLKADTDVEGPLGQGSAGTIEWIDAAAGRLGLRRGPSLRDAPIPAALLAGGPPNDAAQRAAIVRVADAVVRRGGSLDPPAARRGGSSLSAEARSAKVEDPPYSAIEDILRASAPRFTRPRDVIQTLDLGEQKQRVADLDDSYLFIQGPPGSGKTWTGARLIVSLLAAGKRVGVTAPSHRAIHNLLEEVERVAAAERVDFTGLKKRSTSDETVFDGRFITSESDNKACEQSGAQLIAGTAWLLARSAFDQTLDYVFVDEAGQTSLADAVAVGTSARNIVLLGDPQQLPHVTQSPHPDGSGRSVLEHLLGDAATVAPNRGIFLANSWRMHPDVCRFVSELSYDGRLTSAPGCERQRVNSRGLTGTGLRYVPVEHEHNAQQSFEEARAIAGHVSTMLDGGASVTDSHGRERPLSAADILVVAPYNMQVRTLRELLPPEVEVGTVDKFQGREGAVVFFSMTSSTGEDVPRGLEFLFNQNRFNVAVSRAKCLSVLVCSPRLLESRCRTVEQVRLVNAVCRFVEEARHS